MPEGNDDTIAAIRAAPESNPRNPYGAATPYGSNAAAMAAARVAANGGQAVTYGTAVAAVSGGLQELLWADPWDAAALTQLLALLLQVRIVPGRVSVPAILVLVWYAGKRAGTKQSELKVRGISGLAP